MLKRLDRVADSPAETQTSAYRPLSFDARKDGVGVGHRADNLSALQQSQVLGDGC